MGFLIILLVLLVGMGVFLLCTQKYVNPYKLIMIFGKKGSGKSTTLTKLALTHISKGWTVYSTEFIPGTYFITPDMVGKVQLEDFNYKPFNPDNYKGLIKYFMIAKDYFFPRRAKILLLIDEVGMIWDNRDFKNFKTHVRDFFKLERHYYVKCYLFSQTFDIDKKLRDLTDAMYLVSNVARVFVYGKKIRKYITIKESLNDNASTLSEGMEFEPFLLWFLGTRTLTFIPKWSKYFNSFVAPELEKVTFRKQEFEKE